MYIYIYIYMYIYIYIYIYTVCLEIPTMHVRDPCAAARVLSRLQTIEFRSKRCFMSSFLCIILVIFRFSFLAFYDFLYTATMSFATPV